MNKFKSLIFLIALSACAGVQGTGGIKQLGNGLYQISEMGFNGGTTASRAANFCVSKGGNLVIVGNTTQTGMYSGTSYPVLIFRCDGK